MRAFESLRRTGDFQRLMRRGNKRASSAFVLFSAPRPPGRPARVGITTAKAVGIAVARNRTRRRVRAVLDTLDLQGSAADLLFVMRAGAAETPFSVLAEEIARAFAAVR